LLDLDGDGVRDVSLIENKCATPARFSLHLSLRGGQTNVVVNYDGPKHRLTGNVPISQSLRGPVTAELERRYGLGRDVTQRLLASYSLMVDTESLLAVQKLHAEATRAYKARKPAKAVTLLEGQLAAPAISKLDPTDGDENVTALLNDYGFFLSEAGLHERAIAVLKGVVARAPDRAVAYLNLADAEHAQGDVANASLHYRRYATLMWAGRKGEKIPARVTERMARQ
jgi:hypothetical protein